MIGVKYTSFMDAYSGMGNAARNIIRSLHEVDVPLTTEVVPNLTTSADLGKNHQLAHRYHGANQPYDIKILHITPDMILRYLEPMKYHIAHFFWETDRLPPQHVWSLNLVDEVWTGSEWSKRAFRKSGVKSPIYVFPQPVETGTQPAPFKVRHRPEFVFYSVFQWIERKNPRGLLEAYWKEFEGNENVGLMIKTYKEKFTQIEREQIINEIKSWKRELALSHFPKVFIYTDVMTKEDTLRFHASGDAFVLPHRGEGWGVPIAEAMSMGKPVISTNLGGITSFVPHDYWYPVDYRMVNVFNMNWIPFYSEDQKWANPMENDLRTKMRTVYQSKGLSEAAGIRAQKWTEENLSYEAVGKLMKERLEAI